ncbi:hypothetical protein DYB32_000823 [Aphanomyces invadans]|uniref:Uncharacterized protein n=1 Tax=Aphanomyces invadans TaxID=157072 RepID=A0A3R6Z5D3_9STRA|nr:hypothetical protein DYB32_000823 [Aphanomyces invadans]
MQCKYAYKECSNARTYKRDGGLHRLCEFHRSKANALQKVYATKRRSELRAQKRQLLAGKLVVKTEPVVPPCAGDPHVDQPNWDVGIEPFVVADDVDWCALLVPESTDAVDPIEFCADMKALSDEEWMYLSSAL